MSCCDLANEPLPLTYEEGSEEFGSLALRNFGANSRSSRNARNGAPGLKTMPGSTS